MGKVFQRYSGRGIFKPMADFMNTVATMLQNIRIYNGYAVVTRKHISIYIDLPPSATFTGTAYIAGVKITGLNSDATKPWVKCDVATQTATEETGPAPNPFPPNEEWYEKANTAGDIHIPRM